MPCFTWMRPPVQAALWTLDSSCVISCLLKQEAEHVCGPQAPAVELDGCEEFACTYEYHM